MQTRSITWLHLSDLHFCPSRTGYDAERVLRTLLTDLGGLQSSHKLKPDFIFFTGDLAFGDVGQTGTTFREQLAGGHRFLETVRKALVPAVRRDAIFLVPGNHDVQRSQTTADQREWLEGGRPLSDIQQLIQSADLQWERYLARLSEFRDALREHNLSHLLHDPKRLIFGKVRRVRGLTIGVAGLNSAWSSSQDKEKGRLWLGGDWQLKHLKSELGAVDVSFALVHHPFNWLSEFENEQDLWRLAEREFTFLLHGHEHTDWVSNNLRGHARIAAAACYDRADSRNGYNVATFDVSTRILTVWLRRYDDQGGGWVPNLVAGRTDDQGRVSEQLRSPGVDATPPARKTGRSTLSVQSDQLPKPEPFKMPRRGYDIFFAVPMAAVPAQQYATHQADAQRVVRTIRKECKLPRVFYPGEQIASPAEFDPPDVAVRRGLVAITKSRIFMMLYTHDVPSSVLVEAGFALALRIPSVYFVRKGLSLPFLLTAAQQAFPDVKMYDFSDIDAVVKHLKRYGSEIFAELLAVRRNMGRADGFVQSSVP